MCKVQGYTSDASFSFSPLALSFCGSLSPLLPPSHGRQLDFKGMISGQPLPTMSAEGIRKQRRVVELEAMFKPQDLLQIRQAFEETDLDGSGAIDAVELDILLNGKLKGQLTPAQLQDLMATVDDDEDAEIEWCEFLAMMHDAQTNVEGNLLGELISKAFVIDTRPTFLQEGDPDHVKEIDLPVIPGKNRWVWGEW